MAHNFKNEERFFYVTRPCNNLIRNFRELCKDLDTVWRRWSLTVPWRKSPFCETVTYTRWRHHVSQKPRHLDIHRSESTNSQKRKKKRLHTTDNHLTRHVDPVATSRSDAHAPSRVTRRSSIERHVWILSGSIKRNYRVACLVARPNFWGTSVFPWHAKNNKALQLQCAAKPRSALHTVCALIYR
jgi:hypothetical protein